MKINNQMFFKTAYRGKIIRDNQRAKGSWVYGDLTEYSQSEGIIIVDLLEPEECWVDMATVGEYIGINDCNDCPIFEGDIVQTKYGRYCKVIRKITPKFNGWDLVPVKNIKSPVPDEYDLWDSKNLKIVSNIYDETEKNE